MPQNSLKTLKNTPRYASIRHRIAFFSLMQSPCRVAMIYYCYRKATAMQKIQFIVSRGATHHAEMQIPPKSIESVVKKLTARYELDLSKDQKYKRKKLGVSVTDLVIFFG